MPVLIAAAVTRQSRVFVIALAYALLSDVVDGPLARMLHQDSPIGARLDSAADCALYLTVPPTACVVFPSVWDRAAATLVIGYLAYVLPLTYGLVKYRRLTAYHTVGARLSAVLLSVSLFVLIATGMRWPLDISVAVLWASAFEELAITRTLPVWRADVRSIWQAKRLQAALAPSPPHHPGAPPAPAVGPNPR